MDEHRALAWAEFQEYTAAVSRPSQNAHEAVTISTSSSEELTYVHSETGDQEGASFFDQPLREPHAASPQATLRLVRILRHSSDSSLLATSPEALQRLVQSPAAGFDPASFWLLAHRYDGFHRFPVGPDHQYNETLLLGSSMFCALWSFDPKTRSTFALLLCRASSTATVQLVDRALAHYKTYILAPTVLSYVLCTAAIMRTERLSEDPGQLRRIERDTGFAYEAQPQVSARHNVRELTWWLQESGQVVMIMASCKRNLRLVSDVLEYMMARPDACDSVGPAAMPAEIEVENRARRCTSALLQAVPPLLSRIRANEDYVDYMKLRAERLSTTLFALLTHEDAATSADLADASRALAAAARRDSSAMKTMAVMTMAFLPGTFLAALFAVPSLDRTGDPPNGVIRPVDPVYWAFALPATVLVFLVWLMLDNRRALIGFVSKRVLRRSRRTRPAANDFALESSPDLGVDMEPLGYRRYGR